MKLSDPPPSPTSYFFPQINPVEDSPRSPLSDSVGIFHAISGTPTSASTSILWYRRPRPAVIPLSWLDLHTQELEIYDVGFLFLFPMETPIVTRMIKHSFYCLFYMIREARELTEQVFNQIMRHGIISWAQLFFKQDYFSVWIRQVFPVF